MEFGDFEFIAPLSSANDPSQEVMRGPDAGTQPGSKSGA